MRTFKTIMRLTVGESDSIDVYRSESGLTMQREEQHEHLWVLRNKQGEFLGRGAYRNDMAELHGLKLKED